MIIEEYRGPLHGVVLWIADSGEYAIHDFNVEEAVRLGWSSSRSIVAYLAPHCREGAHDRWAERVEELRSRLDGDLRVLAAARRLDAQAVPDGGATVDTLDLLGETQASMRGDA
jgi:hypothetical protein